MLPHPLPLHCTEKLPEYAGELEMYSVRFVLSVAGRHVQDKLDRQRSRPLRLGASDADSSAPADASAPSLLRDRQLE